MRTSFVPPSPARAREVAGIPRAETTSQSRRPSGSESRSGALHRDCQERSEPEMGTGSIGTPGAGLVLVEGRTASWDLSQVELQAGIPAIGLGRDCELSFAKYVEARYAVLVWHLRHLRLLERWV